MEARKQVGSTACSEQGLYCDCNSSASVRRNVSRRVTGHALASLTIKPEAVDNLRKLVFQRAQQSPRACQPQRDVRTGIWRGFNCSHHGATSSVMETMRERTRGIGHERNMLQSKVMHMNSKRFAANRRNRLAKLGEKSYRSPAQKCPRPASLIAQSCSEIKTS
jgi:hypothetical protein